MSYLTCTRPPTSLSTPTPTSSPKVTSCLLALHYCSFYLEQLCLACPHTPCLPGKLVIPPPSCTVLLMGPSQAELRNPSGNQQAYSQLQACAHAASSACQRPFPLLLINCSLPLRHGPQVTSSVKPSLMSQSGHHIFLL